MVIDGADEVGVAAAVQLLNEARILVEAWPGIRVMLTTRPLSALAVGESVALEVLPEDSAISLLSSIAGHHVSTYGWPPPARDAVRRPFFALVAGVYIREKQHGGIRS